MNLGDIDDPLLDTAADILKEIGDISDEPLDNLSVR